MRHDVRGATPAAVHTDAGRMRHLVGPPSRASVRTLWPEAAATHVGELHGSSSTALDVGVRAVMEPKFRHDFSHVRVHTDDAAQRAARVLDAQAFTFAGHIAFGAGRYAPHTLVGRHLLAHELAHVVQQGNASQAVLTGIEPRGSTSEREADRFARAIAHGATTPLPQTLSRTSPARVMCYEASEHLQFGETGSDLQAAILARAFTYKVKPGESLEKLAAKFRIDVKELEQVNAGKLKKWRAIRSGGSGVVTGFNTGEEITIPPVLNEITRDALKRKELSFTLSGVVLDYGDGIAMGDFYADAADMLAAPASELKAIATLIRKERAGGSVSAKDWSDASGGRYTKLAEKNEAHFAPPTPGLVPVSSAAHGGDHKSEWQRIHKAALGKSQDGKKDEAMLTNAFADHFLTDAFAAGHLFNKLDAMEKFKVGLTTDKAGNFIGDAKVFFDKVAATSFVGAVKTEYSKYVTVASYNMKKQEDPTGWFHPSIDEASRFSGLLQGVQKKEPDVLSSVAAKSVHDTLNAKPGGLPVENRNGDKWMLSGDGSLNQTSLGIGRKAVARSQLNVLDAFKVSGVIDHSSKFDAVWRFVPFPTATGEADVKTAITDGLDPKSSTLLAAVVALVKSNYLLILNELVKRKYLRKA